MSEKAPAFQFYPDKWFTDTQRLSPATEGIYIRLLCAMWRLDPDTCAIPDDDEYIAAQIGRSVEDWKKAKLQLQCDFNPILDVVKIRKTTCLFSKGLWKERCKQMERRDRLAENGSRPPRPGSAPRGRPVKAKKQKVYSDKANHKARPESVALSEKRLSSSSPSSSPSSETLSTTSSPPTPSDGGDSLPVAAEVYQKHPHLRTLHKVPMLRGLTLEQWLTIRKNRSPFMDWGRAIAFVCAKAEVEGNIDKPGPFVDSRLGYYEQDHIRDIESAQAQAKKRQRDVSDMAQYIRDVIDEPDAAACIERNLPDFIRSWGLVFVTQVQAILTPHIVAKWQALKTDWAPAWAETVPAHGEPK